MSELLFGNELEKSALENLLALNQIKKYDNEIDKYNKEINGLNEEMVDILREQNIDEEYINRISKYKKLINKIDGDSNRLEELESLITENEKKIKEYQEKISQVEDTLSQLKEEIFNTSDPSKIIDCQNEIENNNIRQNDLNEILNQLISENTPLLIEKEYLMAQNSDVDFNIPNFNKKEINNDLDNLSLEFGSILENLELSVRENIEFCQKKISNRELEIKKYTDKKKAVLEAYPKANSIDIEEAYKILENVFDELGLCKKVETSLEKNIFEEISKEDNESKIEDSNAIEEADISIKDNMENIDNDINSDNEKNEDVEESQPLEEPEFKEEEVEEETEEVSSVSYVLSEGESLMNIAEKVYPSKDNWEAIYYYNKYAIDKYLVANGISSDFDNIKELANDTSVFTGIKLEIPTDYNYKL